MTASRSKNHIRIHVKGSLMRLRHQARQLKCVRLLTVVCVTASLIVLCVIIAALTSAFLSHLYDYATLTTYSCPEDFEGFDNETGASYPIVPNIVHFLRFNQTEFSFIDAMCILAAVKNQCPDKLLIHTNVASFSGKYWKILLKNKRFKSIYEVRPIELPADIFGQKFSDHWHLPHASDVTRIKILMEHGGIYVDSDTYIVRSLDKLRYFEMALAWDANQFLGTQTLVAHPQARFLREWLETYRGHYRSDLWYYNAGELPTVSVLARQPCHVHRVKWLLGAHLNLAFSIFVHYWPNWHIQMAVHLLIRHRPMFDPNYKNYPEFNETTIVNYSYTIGEMMLDVWNWNTENSED